MSPPVKNKFFKRNICRNRKYLAYSKVKNLQRMTANKQLPGAKKQGNMLSIILKNESQ